MSSLKGFYKGKKILITGHTGFKGGWLSAILLSLGANISGASLEPNTEPNIFSLLGLGKKVENNFVDIRNYKDVEKIIVNGKFDIIFHLAAQPLVRDSYDDPLYTFQTNTLGTANVLEAIRKAGDVKAGVIITTDKVYENSEDGRAFVEDDKLGGYDPYSSSKAGAEIVVQSYIRSFFNPEFYGAKHKTLIASARAGNVIGGGDWSKDRLIPDIVRAVFVEKKDSVVLRSPGAVRPWQHVFEPLIGYLMLGKGLYEGEKKFSCPWNFGPNSKNFVSVKQVSEKFLEDVESKNVKIVIDSQGGKHEAGFLGLDSLKANKILGWNPKMNIDSTIKYTASWYSDYYRGKDVAKATDAQINSLFDLWREF